jgi:6-phosphogluconolactonase
VRIAVFPDPESAGRYAARWIASRLRSRVATHKEATVAFSGGAGPVPMFAALATTKAPWYRLRVFQVDERVAPNRDPARNLGLLAGLPVPRSQVIPMSVTLPRLEVAVHRYEVWLPARLDVVHLGLGDDGHTASWPPGDPVVDSGQRVAVVGPFNGHVRLTLTPRTVNEARHRILFVTGEAKAGIIAAYTRGQAHDYPISHVHRTGTLLVADEAAVSQLTAAEILERKEN